MGTNLTGETWGVSPTTFLAGYLLLAVVVTALVCWYRARVVAGDPAGVTTIDGRPEDVAHLNGGPHLAVYAALSAMHVDGTVVTSCRTPGQVRAGGPLTRSATGLQRAIHRSAHRLIPGRSLRTHAAVAAELARIARRLESAGLLLGASERDRLRSAAVLPGLVAALGLVRVLVGATNARPIGALLLVTMAMATVTLLLGARMPVRTRAGDEALRRVREQHPELSPSMHPDWVASGPSAAALSVGAFGLGAMLAAEPAFAEELAAQRAVALDGRG
ncbi:MULTISPECIES: TIGR04222 domain-containing membrane protein [Pseudonocardia]|uniref:TIGR04222 domain protein n=2 Tax=Pseudonocardia TaxID=1847 RepID=A0A1Y2MQY5_PSEAH|nr:MULTISPECIES: TIGR04222 domain-containing membrane protein [Pseudonocardia]OSY37610.1 hypothetical protein BG845_04647 [Pseudonocardia autotrophica]TDN73732.1 uncharacterized protein (TIGR04222 family) [Pseudonocardia autotrophica]BBG04475.1 hypothetical protein Pdca_56840 [Pseudonocardia autotrophica]GEC27279.1 hypothetical protein PSA01_43080 [Pseudonocardia saturnea]